MHHQPHDVLGDGNTSLGKGALSAKTMQENCRAPAQCGRFIEADIQTVLIFIRIVCDVLTPFQIRIGNLFDIDQLIVTIVLVAGPVTVLGDLEVGQFAAGIRRDAKGFVEAIHAQRCFAAAFRMVFIPAKAIDAHKAWRGENPFPDPFIVALMERQTGSAVGHPTTRNDDHL